ncbi:MAG: Ig-like domain-containing protein [Kiritimatiellae bacterium]|nr:Ig-like domain-containing protein [Kiritimatiellia bacterium]
MHLRVRPKNTLPHVCVLALALLCPAARGAPTVTALAPAPGSTASNTLESIVATLSAAIDETSLAADSVRLIRSGGDDVFDNGNDVAMAPNSVSLTSSNQITIDVIGLPMPNDTYRLTLSGSGAGKALKFSGDRSSPTQDLVEIEDATSLHFTNALTVEMWLKPGEYNNVNDEVFLSQVTMFNTGYMVGRNAAASPGTWFFLQDDALPSPAVVALNDGQQLVEGVWQHVAAVLDTSTICVYINGVLTDTATNEEFDMANANSGLPLWLGNYPPDNGRPYNGEMDEVRLWNVARTVEQIHEDMYRQLSGSETGLVGYWQFDEGTGQTVSDSSAEGNHGTLGVDANAGDDDPEWINSTLWGGLKDLAGDALDGEYTDSLPSGNGSPGGDFVATFTLAVSNFPPTVAAMDPAPGATLGATPTCVTVTFSEPLDVSAVDSSTFRLFRSGGDGIFGNGNDELIIPASVSMNGATQASMDVSGVSMPNDLYQVTVSASGAGSALRFAGQRGSSDQDLVQVLDSPSLHFSDGLTVEMWVKPGPYNAVRDEVFLSHVTLFNTGYMLGRNAAASPGTWFFLQDDDMPSPSVVAVNDGKQLAEGVWQHIAGVLDGSTIFVYVNGTLTDTATDDAFSVSNANCGLPLWIGNYPPDLGRPYNGDMDEVRVWNVARSPEQIRAGMYHPLTGTETGLVGYWKFDEGTGQAVNDSTAYANSGTLGTAEQTGSDDPQWVISSLWGPVCDTLGTALDGEYSGSFPSGDGEAGGDFVATFTLNASNFPPAIATMTPTPGAVLDAPPPAVSVTFNKPVIGSLVDKGSFRLIRSGGDGVFGNANDVALQPKSVALVSSTEAAMDLAGIVLPNDLYQVTVSGSGAGSALKFSGDHRSSSQDLVEVNDAPTLHFTHALTIEMWLRPGEYNNVRDEVFLSHVTMVNDGYMIGRNTAASPGRWFFLQERERPPQGLSLTDGQQLSLGVWQHVAAVLDSTTISLYVNGVLTDTASNENFDMAKANSGMPLWLGNYPPDGGRPYNGEMDEVRLWNLARTADQIRDDMYRELTGSESGLVGYWRFNEGAGQVAGDASGEGNDGRLGVSANADASDPVWVASTLWGPIRDSLGNALDGEFAGPLPSGDGTAGGDFVATFTVSSPSEDSDGDGLPDWWEQQIIAASGGAFTSVVQVLPDDDFDLDLATNQLEYVAHTDPTDPASWPTINLAVHGDPGQYGEPQPWGYGTNMIRYGVGHDVAVTSPSYVTNTTRYVCTDWTGTGDVPATGAGTNAAFTATQDSSLTWHWSPEFFLDTEAGANGGLDVDDGWYGSGTPVSIVATANPSYRFSHWTGDVPLGQETSNPLNLTMTQPRAVTAHFETDGFTIVATAGANGVVSPSGAVIVTNGADAAFTFTPAANYHVEDVLIDGVSVGHPGGYTFTNVTASHTLTVAFSQDRYKISGKTYFFGTQDGPVYVEAYGGTTSAGPASAAQLAAPGYYCLTGVPAGYDYWLRAFLDMNTNGVRDATEPMGEYAQNPLTNLLAHKTEVDITLRELSVPGGVSAQGAVDGVILRWAANPEPGIYGYNVYRFDREFGPFEKLNATPVKTLSYTDPDVTAGEVYYYYLTALLKSDFLPTYLESQASAIVSARAGLIVLRMPDYVGKPDSTVRLRLYATDAAGMLGKDMNLQVSYDPALLTPVSQLDTNNATVEKTAMTRHLEVTDNGATATGVIEIATSEAAGGGCAMLKILGCSYAIGNTPVPVEAAYSVDAGYSWTGIKDMKDLNDGGSASVDLGPLAAATNCFVYVRELYAGQERRSDEPGAYVKLAQNGADLGALLGVTSRDQLVSYLRPYVGEDLSVSIGTNDVLYLFELGEATSGPGANWQDLVAYVAYTEGTALAGEGRLFDVLFHLSAAAPSGAQRTHTFLSATLYDLFGAALSVDATDTALLTVSNNYFFGDIDGDGSLSEVGDYELAMELAAGQRAPSGLELIAGDIDGDGTVSERDATLIKRLALGMEINPNDPPAGAGERGTQDVVVEGGGYALSITNFEAQAGAAVQVPVVIDNAEELASIHLTVNFNPQVLSLQSVSQAALATAFGLETHTGSGTVQIALSRESGLLAGSGELVYLNFLVQGNAPAGAFSELTVAQVTLADEYGASLAWNSGVSAAGGGLWVVLSNGVDTDGDSFSDYAEQLYDGSADYDPFDPVSNPTGTDVDAAKLDTDRDGAGDKAEHDAGMNPVSPDLFTAYNDLAWFAGQLSVNSTAITSTNGNPGGTRSGRLVDFDTGAETDVTLTVDGGAGIYENQGLHPAAGTDAHDVFDGKLDATGTLSYGTDNLVLSLSGLNPLLRYELVLYSDRDNADYTGATSRWHYATLSGAGGLRNASSEGTTVTTAIMPNDTTVYNAGLNNPYGYVTRFTDIDPGTDGQVLLTLDRDVAENRYSYLNALMLRVVAPGLYEPQVRVRAGAVWRYAKGSQEASSPPTAWRAAGFDDSGWALGAMPFGYGDPAEEDYGVTLDDMRYTYSTLFLRKHFTLVNPALVTELRFSGRYDDGFIMWINGEEVARVNVAGDEGSFLAHNGLAAGDAERLEWSAALKGADLPPLNTGTNVVAVQMFNQMLTSSDLFIDLQMSVIEGAYVAGDTDRDGMSDLWEHAFFAGTSGGADADSDGDGLRDLCEYIAGTSPTNIANYFAVEAYPSNAQAVVSFQALKAEGAKYEGLSRYYALEENDSLTSNDGWRAVPGYAKILGQNQNVTYPSTNTTAVYRGKVWLE